MVSTGKTGFLCCAPGAGDPSQPTHGPTTTGPSCPPVWRSAHTGHPIRGAWGRADARLLQTLPGQPWSLFLSLCLCLTHTQPEPLINSPTTMPLPQGGSLSPQAPAPSCIRATVSPAAGHRTYAGGPTHQGVHVAAGTSSVSTGDAAGSSQLMVSLWQRARPQVCDGHSVCMWWTLCPCRLQAVPSGSLDSELL